jgi:hypothetical protein
MFFLSFYFAGSIVVQKINVNIQKLALFRGEKNVGSASSGVKCILEVCA